MLGKRTSRIGKDNTSRVVHDGSLAVSVESSRHIGRRTALRPEAGYQQPRMRHLGPKLDQLLRISGSDNRADRPIAVASGRLLRLRLDIPGNRSIHRQSVGHEVLEHATAGVRRLDQDEDARVALDCNVDKRLEAIVAQIGTDGQRIGTPRTLTAGAQQTLGIGRGRRADVVPLAVEDDQ